MLPLPPFAYLRPDTIEEVAALVAEPDTRLLAGGTDLLPSMKHRLFQPKTLVSLARLDALREIREEGTGLSIGATTTLSEIRRHPWILENAPALAAAAATVATRTIQSMATIGGNLALDTRCVYYNQPEGWRRAIDGCLKCEGSVCHVARTGSGCYAAHSADTVPVLMLMEAEVELHSVNGVRRLPVRELYDGQDGRRWLRSTPDEIITRIHLPQGARSIGYHKVRRRGAIDYGALLVAVRKDEAGTSAVLSALGPAPIGVRAENPEALIEAAVRSARPLNTHIVETGWRKHMVRVSVRRALAELDS